MFTPVSATIGGLLIGLSVSLLLLCQGRIGGISGVLGGALRPSDGARTWRLLFLAGLAAGGVLVHVAMPGSFDPPEGGATPRLVLAGLLVGFGTRLGGGCTSGHGVCGIARRSPRSLVATLVFMATAVATVFVSRHVLGASP